MMRECDESRGWGYLRETREMARKAAEKAPESVFSGLDEYLEYLFPGRVWVHDTRFGKRGGRNYKCRPDYLCEDEKLIVEFNGLQHYTNPLNIRKDRENQRVYEAHGFKVVRIPYFIQLTREVVREMFGIDPECDMFDASLPSMSVKWRNTPAFCCSEGLRRMAEDFRRYPQQYEVNLQRLVADDDDEMSGAGLLRQAMYSVKNQLDC